MFSGVKSLVAAFVRTLRDENAKFNCLGSGRYLQASIGKLCEKSNGIKREGIV